VGRNQRGHQSEKRGGKVWVRKGEESLRRERGAHCRLRNGNYGKKRVNDKKRGEGKKLHKKARRFWALTPQPETEQDRRRDISKDYQRGVADP